MAATFDGANLIVTLPSSTPDIDVEQDLYSAWKTWSLLGDNLRFEPAFRPVTSQEIVSGVLDSGAYFFFRNDLGWRLRGAEEDGNYNFVGNLVPQDTTLPMIVPTLGGYTVLILGLQPVTQNVENVAPNVWTYVTEGTTTAEQMMRGMMAAMSGILSGAVAGQSGTVELHAMNGTTVRMTIDYDEHGNRTAVTYNDMT